MALLVVTLQNLPMDDLDDWLENFGKVGKPGEPHALADLFEAQTTLARAQGKLDTANAMQEIASRLRQRVNDPYSLRGFPYDLILPSSRADD